MIGASAVPAALERDLRTAAEGRLAQIWLTPHGFIKAATSGNATARIVTVRGARKTVITFTAPNKTKFEGMLNEQNLVEQIATRFDNPVLGDTVFEAVFRDYKDFSGVKFPTHILQRSGGYPVLDLTITDVKPNVAVSIEVPPNIKQATPPRPQAIKSEILSDGVWNLWLDARDRAVLIEFRDYVAVVEAHDSETVSLAAIEAVRKLVPSKPIRYIINHAQPLRPFRGLRTYVAEGARVDHHADNIRSTSRLGESRTHQSDRLAKAGRQRCAKARWQPDADGWLSRGGPRTTMPAICKRGMLMVYLPKEKILIRSGFVLAVR